MLTGWVRRSGIVALVFATLASSACTAVSEEPEVDPGVEPSLAQTSIVYDVRGRPIAALHAGEDRLVVAGDDIPEVIRQAVVAIEDRRFFEHGGVDIRAIARAAVANVSAGEVVEGGSTITQQLVKVLYVGDAETFARKFEEALLARRLESMVPKDEILTRYLNTVYFGNGAYGIEAAARTYYGIHARDLSLAQAALLAGLIRAPGTYDPVDSPERAEARRDEVLRAMAEQGRIGEARMRRTIAETLALSVDPERGLRYRAPYFVDYVKEWFLGNPAFGETREERAGLLFEGGLRIITGLDLQLQRAAQAAVRTVLPEPGDPSAALTTVDTATGAIRAMVGGRGYWAIRDPFSRLNLAAGGSSGRQTGSAFKIFALVAALEAGMTPSTGLNGSYAAVPLLDGTIWTPDNAEGGGAGNVSLAAATIGSINRAYVNLEIALGDGDAWAGARRINEVAERMGMRCCPRTTQPGGALLAVPAAVLGTNEASTVELAAGIGTLATGGLRVQPTPVLEIRGPGGELLYRASRGGRRVIDATIAATAADILEGAVRYGTGTRAQLDRPVIGKTGTNSEYTDAWFVGAVPQVATAVWVGFPQGQVSMCCGRVRLSAVYGGTWPAEIWRTFMEVAVADLPPEEFPSAGS